MNVTNFITHMCNLCNGCYANAPHVSNPSELIASNEGHLSNYPEASKKIVVFDKYQDICAKDHDKDAAS